MRPLPPHVLVVDTETTGLLEWNLATVIEVGLVELTFGPGASAHVREVDSFLVNPGPAYLTARADEALQVTGITRQQIAERGLSPTTARLRLASAVEGGRATAIAAFGASFDRPMLQRAPLGFTTQLAWRDVMGAAREVMGPSGALPRRPDGEWEWPSLREAAAFFGVVNPQPHRALADADTAARVLAGAALRAPGPSP